MSRIVYVLNGPNLNLLGKRQPEIYGRDTLEDVERDCRALCAELKLELRFFQSNREYELIDWIHEARGVAGGIVINPAAFTHTSVALLDALSAFEAPVIEVHISNVHKREVFSSPFLCVAARRGRDRGLRGARLPARAAPHRRADRQGGSLTVSTRIVASAKIVHSSLLAPHAPARFSRTIGRRAGRVRPLRLERDLIGLKARLVAYEKPERLAEMPVPAPLN